MKAISFLLMTVFFFVSDDYLRACTIVAHHGNDGMTVGNNLDYSNVYPRMWFVPATDTEYGRVCFGFDKNYRTAEGGMNDRGLYISVNALNKETGWKADSTLKDWEEWEGWLGTGVPDGILAKCATVGEANEIFKTYNLFTLRNVKFLIADRSGDSVVIEWSAEGMRFLGRGDEDYQVSTNTVTSDYATEDMPCYRYKLASRMLEEGAAGGSSSDLVRRVLSATHLEFQTPTVYSNICNLRTGEMLVYYFHNFEEAVRINAFEKLKKGRAEHLVRDLFAVKPYVAQVYEDYSVNKE